MTTRIGPYPINSVIHGHALDLAHQLPDNSIPVTVTSPPYFGHRNYNLPPIYWPAITFQPMVGLPEITIGEQECCLGLESDPWAYVAHLVAIFREIHRTTRNDGTLWLNLGDSYANDSKWGGKSGNKNYTSAAGGLPRARRFTGLKDKNLIGIPWMVAKALQADGWILRADCPWLKANPMPDSNPNRPGMSHEYLFMLTKTGRNYFDMEAVKKPFADSRNGNPGKYKRTPKLSKGANNNRSDLGFLQNGEGWNADGAATGRHRRTGDWFMESLQETIDYLITIRDLGGVMVDESGGPLAFLVNSVGYKGEHFACYPPKLVEPMILASTSERGHCPECGNPWVRILEKIKGEPDNFNSSSFTKGKAKEAREFLATVGSQERTVATITTGWQPTCNHNLDPVPALVLDPFFGSGSTGQAAAKNRRHYLGFELNEGYLGLAPKRVTTQVKLF